MNKIRPEFQGKNNSFLNKGFRYISRLILKTFGTAVVSKIIKILNFLQRHIALSDIRYFYYYLYSIFCQQQYVKSLSKNDFISAINTKIKWANLVMNLSTYEYEKYAANDYIHILSKYDFVNYEAVDSCFNDDINNLEGIYTEETYYLYGPNSKNPPDIKYSECVLVVTKDIVENVEKFKDSILFINSIYYHNKIKNNRKKRDELLKKYGRIMINSMHYIDDKDIKYSAVPPGSELCGLMEFGRVLYNLILNNGRVNCVVDGYDMYVEEFPYSKYYPTLTRQNNELNEALIVQGLADHDFIYDFLKVKELMKNVNLIDSDRFSSIINMPLSKYLEKIATVRNFKLLEKIK